MPTVAMQALERMSDPDFGVSDLAAILRNDPAIVARLLAVANSAACGLQTRVTDVAQVVALLGKPAVVSIVMAIALAPSNDIAEYERPHYRKYWSDAVTMATSAELLAKSAVVLTSERVNPAEFFTAGLLADVGRLALLQCEDLSYVNVLEDAAETGEFPREAEERLLGTTHVSASLVLMRSWNAPEFVIDAAKQHHCELDEVEEEPGVSSVSLIRTLIFSAALVDYLGGPTKSALLDRLLLIGERSLGLTETEVEEHIGAVLDRLAETADLFTILPTEIDEMRGRFVAGLENVAVSASQEHSQATVAESLQQTNAELTDRLAAITVKASRDGLTGVFNREYFEACVSQSLENDQDDLGLIFIDVDRFKQINDEYGHVAGDAVLKGIARTLQEALRPTDLLSRFGGDEFVILITGGSAVGLQRISDRLKEAVAGQTYCQDGVTCSATISVGGVLAYMGSLPTSVGEFLSAADAAMYQAKTAGKNRVHIDELRKPRTGLREVLDGPDIRKVARI